MLHRPKGWGNTHLLVCVMVEMLFYLFGTANCYMLLAFVVAAISSF
jgi:hypothetical protein